jgi:hypothetical protein
VPSFCQGRRTAWLLIVMPRSRSMSIRSRYCARICRPSTIPVSCSIRSARVDLPWSMCAMMQKLRITAWSVLAGAGALLFLAGPWAALAGSLIATMLP